MSFARNQKVYDPKPRDFKVYNPKPREFKVLGETTIFSDPYSISIGQPIPWGGLVFTYPNTQIGTRKRI